MEKTRRIHRHLNKMHKVYYGGRVSKDRLVGLVDGAVAIIITLMVLEIPTPETMDNSGEIHKFALSILVYFASFIIVGTQWNRHHHIMEKVEKVTNSFVWKNLIYIFTLSLIPLFMKWVISFPGEVLPALGYAVVYLLTDLCARWVHISSLGEKTGLFHGIRTPHKRYHLSKSLVTTVWIISILAISIFIPQVEIFFLIILPVTISLFTVFEDERES